jgi:hypothetical protein
VGEDKRQRVKNMEDLERKAVETPLISLEVANGGQI